MGNKYFRTADTPFLIHVQTVRLTAGLPRARCALAMTGKAALPCHCEACGASRGNPVQELPTAYKFVRLYRLPLTRTARRGRRALRTVERTFVVGRDDSARRVQELPNPYKHVRLTTRLPRARCALAMTGKAALIVIARLAEQAVAIPCRDYQLRTNLFVFSVCRCAEQAETGGMR